MSAARKAAEKKVLPREKFLRYLHVVADAEASEDAPTFEEIALAEHDAALRAENARLRDALRHIESADTCHWNTYRECVIALRRLARSALASNPMETIKP